MTYQISDLDQLNIYITYDDGEWIIPKFRIFMVVDEPICYLYWTDTEKGTGGFTRMLPLNYNDVQFGYLTPTSASEVKLTIEGYQTSAFISTAGFVPYTGATNDVNLGTHGLTADFVAFSQTPTTGPGNAQIGYVGNTQALAYDFDNTNVRCNIGQQMYAFVKNAEAVTINKGEAVYLYQASGNKATIKLAYNTSDATSAKTLGLAAEDIASGQNGLVITQGVLDGINTGAYTDGDTLYLGVTPGSWTATKPYAPNHMVYLGIVERANAGNGQIYVRPQNGYELDEIHDVDLITTPPIAGDVLTYDGSLWVAQAPTGGSGITTLNGQTGTTQSFATGTIGTDFNILSALNVHVFNIPTASATNRGALSTADWTTFNGKLSQASADTLYLKLDQTTPQTVINGVPTFNGGIIGYLKDSGGNLSVDPINRELRNSSGTSVKFDWENMKFPTLTTNGFLKTTGGDGTLSVDTNTYQDTLVSGTNIKTVDGLTLLSSGNAITGTHQNIIAALGSTIKATTFPFDHGAWAFITNTVALVNQQLLLLPIYLQQTLTLTGVKIHCPNTGNYTGNNYNGVGLYTYSGGTLTLVASTTNDPNFWKPTANVVTAKPFATPYSATAGMYYLGALYCQSAQTTAPTILNVSMGSTTTGSLDFTNSAKIFGTVSAKTSLPATQAMSGVTARGNGNMMFVY